jgi:hypothetical protein
MQHVTGISRQQLQISSLEDKINQDNPVRFIEAFVHNIDLELIGVEREKEFGQLRNCAAHHENQNSNNNLSKVLF